MKTTHAGVNSLPYLGSGLGFRYEIADQIIAAKTAFDFVEVISDRYIDNPAHLPELEALCDVFRVIPHGVNLSIGSTGPLDPAYLRNLTRLVDLTRAPYYSEHLAITRVPGIDIGHLSPLWFTEEALQVVVDRVNRVQDTLGVPLVLENVTYLFTIPAADMTQAEFFHRIVRATGCGILLDITNVYINSVNHHFDPVEFLDAMPLDHVVQVHLAGGYWSHDVLIDGHSQPVQEESWQLLGELARRCPVRGVILEHDANYPAIDDLVTQVRRARDIISAPTLSA